MAPPIPEQVVTPGGKEPFLDRSIQDGHNVWQSLEGQAVGSIQGHGPYVARTWSAGWLAAKPF
ncbi:hypothetical protein [Longimicrobium sp.]|jgi:nitric oxide reductase subunit B|uniref:hypothetical protein n=1 Tax=Longimicrobium sp. TaxID=2029185 RepID=UPI0039C9DAE4